MLLNSSVVPTPQSPHSGDEGDSDAGTGAPVPAPPEQKGSIIPGPVWRWVSTQSGIRLGVPSEVVDSGMATSGLEQHSGAHAEHPPATMSAKPPAVCNVSGCEARRKYRLVHDFELGACGLDHLRVLTGAA